MEVSKATARMISDDIKVAINDVLKKHGLELRKFNTKYGLSYGLSMEASPVKLTDNGVNEATPEASAYKSFHRSYGLPDGLLGKKFTVSGKQYAFAGIATSRPKYPMYAKNLADGSMVFFTEKIKLALVDA